MNLKDFSLVSPVIQAGEILRAIEVAIPPEAIEQALTRSQAQERRLRALAAPERGLSSYCHELVVNRLYAGCTEEFN
jgi:hypothetical protein